jgi:hypothetical protein
MNKILKTTALAIIITFSSLSFEKTADLSNYCPQGYTFVTVYENNLRWIYVYCENTLIERYIDNDYIPE